MPKSNQNFFAKLREDKGARAIALTVTVMLLVLTAIIITTVIANRAAKEQLPTDEPFSEQAGLTDPDDTPQAEQQAPPAQNTESDTLPNRFLLPVSGVMQKKHNADIQVFSDTMKDYRVHLGIDIGTIAGANVCAMADGVIAQVWEDIYMGQCIAIKHNGDAYTIYKNLNTTLPTSVKPGAAVKAGDVIGTVGESAMNEICEEPHLHLEMLMGDLQVNPVDYLDESARAALSEDTNYEDVS